MSLIKKFKMKKMLALTLAAFMSFTTVTAMPIQPVNAVEEPASLERQLIPLPVDYEVTQDKFTISEDTNIYVKGLDDEQTDELYENVGEYLASKLRASTGYELPVVKGDNEGTGNIAIVISDSESDLGEEGYKIKTTEAGVEITANQPAGAFMAVQTVRQLLPADIEKTELVEGVSWVIPCSSINDKPEYEYRGSHLDVTRHFFSVEDVKRYIDNMAQYKMNKLHLHLSDDQGWRLEIKGEMYGESLSKLNTIGAQTSTSINGIKAGQYTQEDYKELVAYAADRYVEIIPEFDMPGHSWAALVSLNFLNSSEDGKPHSGNYDNTKPYEGIDVGFSTFECRNEKTYEFIDEVFRQVAAISPSKYIHIGGDEAHSTSSEDYAYFMNRVTEIAKKYGKTPIGWQNYDGVVEDKEGTVTLFWETGNEKMKAGIKYVISPADYAYMDMKYDASCELGLQWAGYNSIEDTYSWDPTNYGDKENIVGIEACLWSETLANNDHLDYMAYPKILSHAEIGWTPKELRSWDTYKPRLIAHGERLENQGIKFNKDEDIWEVPYEPVNGMWNLDEGKGNTITDTEGKYTGTLQGDVSWIDGVKGSALDFNGSGYVDLNIDDLEGNWSAGMWVKRSENSATNTALLSGDQGEIKLEQWENTTKVGITEFGVEDYSFNYTAPIDEWVHLTFVSDESGTTLYVNGEYQDHLNVTINGPLKRIGANAKSDLADTGSLYGSLDEISVYNRALSADEVKELAKLPEVDSDKTSLKIAIDLANAITDEDLANVVPAVADEFIAARDEANAVYNNASASQVEVNNAFDRLASAMHMLDFVKGDKTALKAFIDKVTGLEAAKYTEATWTAFETELNEAIAVYDDENAMQEEVNTAYSELVTAFLNLRLIPDKSLLEDLINQANGLNKANYTKATFDGLTKALNEAKAVYENPNATQEEVDNAKDILAKAIAGLQTVTTDNTVSTPVNNGDTTTSVKTGDESLAGMFATIALLSVAGYTVLRKKED